ncbi:hypothetical protein [Microbacterium enclense]|uniref:Uncharacterized protein n=1 Tax=Microbacterium enclense TaxID=993073 RepID=A0A1G6IB83_9MICO|nr:hypothetical protein [Microbacterium enclense]KSU55034.1 hypothetical protein AS029_06010 [Microbacterium enclense]SDC03789.1 hypothetical protein SAMN05216418_1458 [Microbacterium enclense]
MDNFTEGLRCQDVTAGLRNLHPMDASLAALSETQRVGMAAGVAALIRGQDVVEDASNLRTIVAEQLDVPAVAFNSVIDTLEQAQLVTDVKRAGQRVVSFSEKVPFYSDLYTRLGGAWREAAPSGLEQQVLLLVDSLAKSPIARDDLVDRVGLDSGDLDTVLEVTTESQLVQRISLGSDEVLYSPFFGFEQPAYVAEVVRNHGAGELADAFEMVRGEQGLSLARGGEVIADAVKRGLLMAPSVELPNGSNESFAVLPYSLDLRLLRERKPVMDKALAVIACLRTAQHHGGYSNLTAPALVNAIDKLLREGRLNPHSSHERQYRTLNRAGLLRFGPDTMPGGKWVVPILIDTPDNREALTLARDLITHGESMIARQGTPSTLQMLDGSDPYSSPIQTVHRMRQKRHLTDKKWQSAIDKMMGHGSA